MLQNGATEARKIPSYLRKKSEKVILMSFQRGSPAQEI
jgi:hypothetical protein